MNKIKELCLLEAEKDRQMQRIRAIEGFMQELYEKEQQLEKQLCEVKNQEEKILNVVTKELKILDKIDENIETLGVDNVIGIAEMNT